MKTTTLLILFLFCGHLVKAQQKQVVKTSQQKSIYTLQLTQNTNDYTSLNNRLKLTNFNFVFVNDEDIDNGTFNIAFKNIGKKPSTFIYDDYNNYRDNNLLKGFFRKHDLTRWLPNELRLQ